MAVRKISVSMPGDVVASAQESALRKELGLSAWLTEAAREKLRAEFEIDEGYQAAHQLIVEYEAQHGPVPQEAVDWADRIVAAAYPREQPESQASAG